MGNVVEELRTRQLAEGLTDLEFATKLEVSRQWWNFLRNGVYAPTERFWRKVVRVYPDLANPILTAYREQLMGTNPK